MPEYCRYILVVLVLSCSAFTLNGQVHQCGTDVWHDQILSQNLDLKSFDQEINLSYRKSIHKISTSLRSEVITLPVIFHIIHQGGEDNITEERVLKGLENLNDAFRNRNYYNPETGIDTKIQFCLARRDTSGIEINGILRHQSTLSDMSTHFNHDAFTRMAYLDPSNYINIRILTNVCLGIDCNRTGYAVNAYTGELSYRNGIIIQYDAFGLEPYDDIVIIHEMGHFLGLRHTFYGGCKNDDCLSDGDRICDTPPDNSTAQLWCTLSENSCMTDEDDSSVNNPFRSLILGGLGEQEDHNHNYMDYAGYICYDQFSQGQADRMHWYVANVMPSLLSSKACYPPCDSPAFAFFNPSLDITINVGENLLFDNTTSPIANYIWYYNRDSIASSADLDLIFLELGQHTIMLAAFHNDMGCDTSFYGIDVEVVCPVVANFDYLIYEDHIMFSNMSALEDNVYWTISGEDNAIIYTSTESIDSFYFGDHEFIQLCIDAQNLYCEASYCEFITTNNNEGEICNDEIDNDLDGFVDMYDSDCPCDNFAFQAQCDSDCEVVPDSFPEFKMKLKWQSEILGRGFTGNIICADIDSDSRIDVITKKTIGFGVISQASNFILSLDGTTGETNLEFRHGPDNSFAAYSRFTAIGDVDRDGFAEIFTTRDDSLYCYSHLGNVIWQSHLKYTRTSPYLADFNGDNFPEVYIGNQIYNATTGALIFEDQEPKGCSSLSDLSPLDNSLCDYSNAVAADLTDAPGLELAAGNVVYELNITNLNGTSGNTANIVQAPAMVTDGLTSIGDIDGDGYLDIIVNRSSNFEDGGGLWVWNPRFSSLIASAPSGIDGSIPTIGNMDYDSDAEIAVIYPNELRVYDYDGTNVLSLKYSIPTTDDSGFTGLTIFDFNQDGSYEIVYRDETDLRIIDGNSGLTISSTPVNSGTGGEFPIVADIDSDGEAEILVNGYIEDNDEYRIYCFESDGVPWAPARSVWNQAAYHVTNVNDDLTIPRYPQNQAAFFDTDSCAQFTCPQPYNSFMSQATYRTQEGCVVWPGLNTDLSISATLRCLGDSIEICLIAIGGDSAILNNGVTVSCYSIDDIDILDQVVITQDTTCFYTSSFNDMDSILIVINDSGSNVLPNTDLQECDFDNNEFVLDLRAPDFAIDILDYECSSDSLIFYIATDNIGTIAYVECINGACYFENPFPEMIDLSFNPPLEVTAWCFEFDTTLMQYEYQDTFRVAIPIPIGQTEMWWTINDNGTGLGIDSSNDSGVYECNYENNIAYMIFNIDEKTLELGEDIVKCKSEVFTLNPGSGFENYLWNDFTTDSLYSSSFKGLHYIEAIDQCGRVYRDTVLVSIDDDNDIDLGNDFSVCLNQEVTLEVVGDYDELHWFPADFIDCDTCREINFIVEDGLTLIVSGRKDNCFSLDTINIEMLIPVIDSLSTTFCYGDTIDFFGQQIVESGTYQYLKPECDSLNVLDARFELSDTTMQERQICTGDTLLFMGTSISEEGTYPFDLKNQFGCDSLVLLEVELSHELQTIDTLNICQGDSIQVLNVWIDQDTMILTNYLSNGGCDSVHIFDVRVLPELFDEENISLCNGDSVLFYSQWFYDEGDFTANKKNSTGCDSIIDLTISLRPTFESFDTISFCQGDTIEVFGFNIFKTTDINESYQTSFGCDSTIHIHARENLPETSEEDLSLCPGDSIYINNDWVFASGSYEIPLVSSEGCDSTHIIVVNDILVPQEPILDIDCENGLVLASIDEIGSWKVLWDNSDTTNTTVYHGQNQIFVTLTNEQNCQIEYSVAIPLPPNTIQLIDLKDTSIAKNESLEIDLNLDSDVWNIIWTPTDILNCDTCSNVIIQPDEQTIISVNILHVSGCEYEMSFTIKVVEHEEIIYIPNIFSPNNDGHNDEWKVILDEKIELLSINVFDRWGNLVYQSVDSAKGWNGMIAGKLVQQGVYVYRIMYKDNNNINYVKIGDLTLLR